MRDAVISKRVLLDGLDLELGQMYAGIERLAPNILPAAERQELGLVVEICEQVIRLAMRASAYEGARRLVKRQLPE